MIAGISDETREFHMTFSYSPAEGLGLEEGWTRRDPSDVAKIGPLYYVWYTKTDKGPDGYNATVWCAASPDGHRWTEKGEAIARGGRGAWDEHSVFTPNILVAQSRCYLFYTAVPEPFTNTGPDGGTKTAIGVAVSDSPDGPWTRFEGKPILKPSDDANDFDSHRIDDSCLIVRDGKYWLYYKGRQMRHSPAETKMGLAVAGNPTGPYVRHPENPLIGSGHEVLVWPHREGIVAWVQGCGPEGNTIQYAPDGLHFSVKASSGPPSAAGAYRPDAFTDTKNGQGIEWGISQQGGRHPHLVRYNCAWP